MLWKLAFNGTMVEQAKCSEDVLKRCEETWSFEPNPPVYSSLQWWRLCLSVRQPFWGRRRFIWPKHKWLLKPFWREPFFFWFQFAKPFFCSAKYTCWTKYTISTKSDKYTKSTKFIFKTNTYGYIRIFWWVNVFRCIVYLHTCVFQSNAFFILLLFGRLRSIHYATYSSTPSKPTRVGSNEQCTWTLLVRQANVWCSLMNF